MDEDLEKLIIDGQEVEAAKMQDINVSFSEPKKQVLLLDFKHYPCLLIYLENDVANVVAELERGSENYKHFEKNKLIDVGDFRIERKLKC